MTVVMSLLCKILLDLNLNAKGPEPCPSVYLFSQDGGDHDDGAAGMPADEGPGDEEIGYDEESECEARNLTEDSGSIVIYTSV